MHFNQDSVDDLRLMLEDTIRDPQLMGHIRRTHEATVHAIYETAEPIRKKRKRTTLADPGAEAPGVTALRLKHEAIHLRCWPLTIHAASFIRPTRQQDHNTLINVKSLGVGPTSAAGDHDALLSVTVYNRLSWGQKILSRASQHVLLSSQSLRDLFEAIPCTSKEIPHETRDETGTVTGYRSRRSGDDMAVDDDTGAAVCIEDVLYGDCQSEDDYADKVLRQLQSLPEEKRPSLTKGGPMHDTKLSSLTVRLNEPYWLLHAGSCEHFFTFTTIRLRHPSDPPVGYPLTTQITPPLCDNCRVCTKVPAVYSVVGDIRLGESPFLICGPCWRWMGNSSDESEVLVVPLPIYEIGWTGNSV
ncbi:hypothetical protein DICSQDRAFT_50534 [Dichomitus squalens LYAD-421 SS1]|uniref:uncharacterized protein n=1 Tax=Dichomitus squalens (strain LYAD-421) TaxID=732165 RepID=UPI0004414DF8|nr:uncharacterized protein DICSQDRAFT_50534 [Dichomitus squalens LYAD-421 SS1]EJF65316.1 hypothetical protein DICSQDRAFT_50534 [Dichomitus squalens LYAD-421 SS1]